MSTLVYAVDRPEVPRFSMPDRFRHDITYFMTPPGEHGVPPLPEHHYWVRLEDSRRWYDDGVIEVVSPLDSENKTELELTDEQEDWLAWMIEHEIEQVRVETASG